MTDHRIQILLIEDNPGDARLIRELLLEADRTEFKIEAVERLSEGLELLQTKGFDVVLLDLSLPDSSGPETLAKVYPEAAQVAIIVLTCLDDEEVANEALRKGAQDYLVKSQIEHGSLLRSIRYAVERKRAEEALQKAHDELERRVAERTAELARANEELQAEIAARNWMEETLRESENLLRTVINATKEAMISIGQDGLVTIFNSAAEEMFGYKKEEITGKPVDCLMPAEYRERHSEYIRNFFAESEQRKAGSKLLELPALRSDGSVFPMEMSLSAGKYGDKQFIIAVARDISDRKRAEEEKKRLEARLQQAQKMEAIGKLAGGIAHDFNNVLTPIVGYTELTMSSLPESSQVREYLREVLNAAMRARDLVQQILAFSRKSEQELKPLKVQPLVQEALKLLRASLPATIRIDQNIDRECGVILADPTRIHQIIMNLCTNAYHAMREKGGVLEVSLAEINVSFDALTSDSGLEPGPYLRLSVSDNGHGMDRSIMERIFDPYFTTKAPGEGTGMGLSVVHGIVKSYGGDIRVYSESGKGTTFHVHLPIIKTDLFTIETLSSELTAKGYERILLVDDEKPIARSVQKMLEHLGYSVTAQNGSVEALEVFRIHPGKFDLVITDQTMPDMTGAQLAQKLLDIRPDIPIILCTGFSEVITEERAKGIGIREYVMKPVVMSEISKTIRKVLDSR
jgi:PAS domain S-box-containing protein